MNKAFMIDAEKVKTTAYLYPGSKHVLQMLFPEAFVPEPVPTAELARFMRQPLNRLDGKFKDKGFYLDKNYNWQIETDEQSATVLVAYAKT